MHEYRTSKGMRIFLFILAPPFILLGGWLALSGFIPAWNAGLPPASRWLMLPVGLFMVALFTLALLEVIYSRIVVDSHKIGYYSTLYSREFHFEDIRGYRRTEKGLMVLESYRTNKKLQISGYLGRGEMLRSWISEHFQDLDALQQHEETMALRSNQRYGLTSEEREARVHRARNVAKILNWAGALIAGWALFKPVPYNIAILAAIAMPVACIIAIFAFHGLLRLYEQKNSPFPNVFMGLFLPSMAIALRSMLDFELLDYPKAWSIAVLPALLLTALIVMQGRAISRPAKDRIANVIIAAAAMIAYAFGSLATLNCIFDRSAPTLYDARIVDKSISSGKSKTYYLKLSPWGSRTSAEKVSVGREQYEQAAVDEGVRIYVMKGGLGIPWFELELKQ